jgi:NAD(P)-dependent dehydrogenase (short-subunit alcohol dehydrogenase family)
MAGKQQKSRPMSSRSLFSIQGKVALVTGGSRGIGLMIARGYVESGARVYISSRTGEVCNQIAEELTEKGSGTCISVPADIHSEQDIQELSREIIGREKALNILVNNAGANWAAKLEEYPDAGFNKVMTLNVKSMFLLTRELLPLLGKAATPEDPARVINIGSIDGIAVPKVENYAYSASKAAVHHMTRVLAGQLGRRNITVNAIAPGPFESKMTKWMLDNLKEMIIATCPLGRIGTPEDMAGAAIYLASRAGAYVNGAIIPVDGGITTQ